MELTQTWPLLYWFPGSFKYSAYKDHRHSFLQPFYHDTARSIAIERFDDSSFRPLRILCCIVFLSVILKLKLAPTWQYTDPTRLSIGWDRDTVRYTESQSVMNGNDRCQSEHFFRLVQSDVIENRWVFLLEKSVRNFIIILLLLSLLKVIKFNLVRKHKPRMCVCVCVCVCVWKISLWNPKPFLWKQQTSIN